MNLYFNNFVNYVFFLYNIYLKTKKLSNKIKPILPSVFFFKLNMYVQAIYYVLVLTNK